MKGRILIQRFNFDQPEVQNTVIPVMLDYDREK